MRLLKIVCRVEFIVIILLSGMISLFILKYPAVISPTNWLSGTKEQDITLGKIPITPLLVNEVLAAMAVNWKLFE